MTIGLIVAFFGYITFMLWPIQDLARVYSELQNAIASAERVFCWWTPSLTSPIRTVHSIRAPFAATSSSTTWTSTTRPTSRC